MYTGEIQAMWTVIRPKEHGRTRQNTSLTEVQEKLRKAGVYPVDGYVAVVDPWRLRSEWRGWRYPEVGTAVRYVNTLPRNATTRGLDTVAQVEARPKNIHTRASMSVPKVQGYGEE